MQPAMYSRRKLAARHLRGALLLACTLLTAAAGAMAGDAPRSGGWRLADAASPYLRMHADNPVDWYPWSEAAFDRARRENKPLFISIGYFTCHWCHVMERESFMNPEIAALLNRDFVAIKVDREQRPDIDAAYQRFVNLTRGIGGWPATVFATSEGYPFAGGTYFPPDAVDGHPGLRELLQRVHRIWRDQPEKVAAAAASAVTQLREAAPGTADRAVLDKDLPAKARRALRHEYDELAGGFGEAPKFPQAPRLLFLLHSPDAADRDMALHTLDAIADGAIHDQLAGGFHRYTTDPLWRVPHFEKMLYDQGLNARAYLAAWRISGRQRYADLVRRTLDFTLARMRAPDGSFYAALAADSLPAGDARHPLEGAYYSWDNDQWRTAMPETALRELASERYGVRAAGNVEAGDDEALAGRNLLFNALPLPALAERHGHNVTEIRALLQRADRRLLSARLQRPAPPLDDKMVAAWNGYLITALADAGRQLDEPSYLDAARQCADAVLTRLYDSESGNLYRDYSDGRRGAPAFAADYAALAEGLLSLHAADGETRWLSLASALTERQIALFWDNPTGGFFSSRADTRVWLRDKQAADGAEPAANSISLGNLILLAHLTDTPSLLDRARRAAGWAGNRLAPDPAAMPYALIQWPALLAADDDPATARD